MYRASRVLGNTTAHLARRPLAPQAFSLVQRSFAAVAITPVDQYYEVASSAHTTVRDGSKDKPEEEWQKMVEVRASSRSAGACESSCRTAAASVADTPRWARVVLC